MSSQASNDSTSNAIQISFGVFAVLSVVSTVLGFHFKDSLCCVLCRSLTRRPTDCMFKTSIQSCAWKLTTLPGHDHEMGTPYTDNASNTIMSGRQPNLQSAPPPSYARQTVRSSYETSTPSSTSPIQRDLPRSNLNTAQAQMVTDGSYSVSRLGIGAGSEETVMELASGSIPKNKPGLL